VGEGVISEGGIYEAGAAELLEEGGFHGIGGNRIEEGCRMVEYSFT
jgi:hypothetical protein